jgi:predicted ATPase/class 3 adenylate cyclase
MGTEDLRQEESASQSLAIVFTDLVDSTSVASRVGDSAMAEVWTQHDTLARGLMRRLGGREIGRSDGFLVVFGQGDAAVAFASAYHDLVQALSVPLQARVGLHVGQVTLRTNREEDLRQGATLYEIDGVAVPIAARVMSIARAGQTLSSRAAVESFGDRPFAGVAYGHWRIKGLDEPIELFGLQSAGDSMPPEDTEKAYRVVSTNGDWLPVRDIRHSIPAERDSFVGRSAAMHEIADLFLHGARLVSIVGMGGIGKTRVATRFARAWLGEFPGGVWFCDLSRATTRDGIFFAVAQGMDVQLGKSEPHVQLADAIRGRGRCLVILDNFEQVVGHAHETVTLWLERSPDARLLVTTRERLGVPGEHVLWLDVLRDVEAATLFVQRAGAVWPLGAATRGEDAVVGQLIRLLDGLPLAIELAAARMGAMSPQALLARIGKRFELLSSRRGRLGRQATLRAAFDWSWDLLTREEKSALAQTSVFAGGFSLEIAEGVLKLEGGDERDPICDVVQSLIDKSLIRRSSMERLVLLESVREYAGEKLDGWIEPHEVAGVGLKALTERRHCEYFAGLVLSKTREDAAHAENIVVACRRAIALEDSELAAKACANAWSVLSARGPYRVGLALIESALAMSSLRPVDAVKLLNMHGRCLLVCGKTSAARTQLVAARELAVREKSLVDEVDALTCLAEVNAIEGHMENAKRQYEEAIELASRLDMEGYLFAALNGLGIYFNRRGRFAEARALFQRAFDAAQLSNDRKWQGIALSNLGPVAANLGDRADAKACYDGAIAFARDLGDRVWEGNLLCNAGLLSLEEDDKEAADAALTASLRLARDTGNTLLESIVLCNLGLLGQSMGNHLRAHEAYRDALAVARRRDDRRTVGQVLTYHGSLLALQERKEEGFSMLVEAVRLLREVNDAASLAIALCRHARACLSRRDIEAARASIDEAVAIAEEIGVKPSSELGLAISDARSAFADALSVG